MFPPLNNIKLYHFEWLGWGLITAPGRERQKRKHFIASELYEPPEHFSLYLSRAATWTPEAFISSITIAWREKDRNDGDDSRPEVVKYANYHRDMYRHLSMLGPRAPHCWQCSSVTKKRTKVRKKFKPSEMLAQVYRELRSLSDSWQISWQLSRTNFRIAARLISNFQHQQKTVGWSVGSTISPLIQMSTIVFPGHIAIFASPVETIREKNRSLYKINETETTIESYCTPKVVVALVVEMVADTCQVLEGPNEHSSAFFLDRISCRGKERKIVA